MVKFIKVIQLIDKESPSNEVERIPTLLNLETVRFIAFTEKDQAEVIYHTSFPANKKGDDTLDAWSLIEVKDRAGFIKILEMNNLMVKID